MEEARDGQTLPLEHVIHICGESWTRMFLRGEEPPGRRRGPTSGCPTTYSRSAKI